MKRKLIGLATAIGAAVWLARMVFLETERLRAKDAIRAIDATTDGAQDEASRQAGKGHRSFVQALSNMPDVGQDTDFARKHEVMVKGYGEKWTLPLVDVDVGDGSGDKLMELPVELLDALGWVVGDELELTSLEGGEFRLRRIEPA